MAHAPYGNAMRIGQGFNTYTQDIRLEDAVRITKRSDAPSPPKPATTAPASTVTARNAPLQPGIAGKLAALRSSQSGIPTPPGTPLLTAARRTNTSSNIVKELQASQATVAQTPAIPQNDAPPPTVQSSPQLPQGEPTPAASPAMSAMSILGPTSEAPPFTLVAPEAPPPLSQSVTFSTRSIENVSDIMDALNISTAMSIGYGTIHGNGSAAFVNESKVLDAELNYIVSVNVNNDCSQSEPVNMEFQPIDEIPPDKFTEVYGDSFISGFEEGGVFNAIISIQVNDKRKVRQVKQAVDLQLAVGPAPVTIGAKESFDKSHAEALQDTEITISVNWSGGGEVKKPDVPWSLASVVAVANAFPSMVARNASRTSAILTRYEALRSFQAWKWKMTAKDSDWARRFIILDYTPCTLYTADLFDAMMAYKKLWKRIGEMLHNPTKYKAREQNEKEKEKNARMIADIPSRILGPRNSMKTPVTATTSPSKKSDNQQLSPCDRRFLGLNPRLNTFDIDDDMIEEDWDLSTANQNRTPIPVDPVALNEARLACREAMTLITEEAARLVDHPHLAYAEFNQTTGKTQMKRPNYAYPEVLKSRLPILVGNDAADDSWSQDPAAVLTHSFSREDDLYCQMIGDVANPHRSYKAFTSLTLHESPAGRTPKGQENELTKLCLHSYHHHSLTPSSFSKDSDNAIGAIGFGFARDKAPAAKDDDCPHQHYGHPSSDSESVCKKLELKTKAGAVDITRIDVCYVPGSGRIAGLVFYDKFGEAVTERLALRQWGNAGHEPNGLEVVTQQPPDDGQKWTFAGVCGEFDTSIWGGGTVLSRVSGIWRRV